MSITIDVSEVYALAGDLKRAPAKVRARAETAVAVGGHRVLARMQVNTPVDTGNLKSSESVDVDGLRFEVGPTADYGVYVELGTSRMAAEPYAGPAFDQELDGILNAIGEAGSRIL
jgi:HK97 gp10 family phage protein